MGIELFLDDRGAHNLWFLYNKVQNIRILYNYVKIGLKGGGKAGLLCKNSARYYWIFIYDDDVCSYYKCYKCLFLQRDINLSNNHSLVSFYIILHSI